MPASGIVRKLKFFLTMSLLGLAPLEGCFYMMAIFVIPKVRYYSPPTLEEFTRAYLINQRHPLAGATLAGPSQC